MVGFECRSALGTHEVGSARGRAREPSGGARTRGRIPPSPPVLRLPLGGGGDIIPSIPPPAIEAGSLEPILHVNIGYEIK